MLVIAWLIKHRKNRLAQQILFLLNVEIPSSVTIGQNLTLEHRGRGVVIAFNAAIGDDVTIYHNVTIGRARVHCAFNETVARPAVRVGNHAVLSTGCVVLGSSENTVTVGEGTIVGANSVLNRTTGVWEIWAGVPARKIGDRDDRPTFGAHRSQRNG